MKKLVATSFALIMLLSFSSSIYAAGCGNWSTKYTVNYCDSSTWCGPLNPKDAWMQTQYNHRQCVKDNNTTYWEFDNVTSRTGSCCTS